MSHYYPLISKEMKKKTSTNVRTLLVSALLPIFVLSACDGDTPVDNNVVKEISVTPVESDAQKEIKDTPVESDAQEEAKDSQGESDTQEGTTETPADNDMQNEPSDTPDTTAPVITLNGDDVVSYIVGEVYSELGASVTDGVDSNLTIIITGEVDVDKLGVYTITYTATDNAGNIATAIRTINVTSTLPEDLDDNNPGDQDVCDATVPVGLNENMEAAITLAESRYSDLLENIATSSKKYISYTNTSGVWEFEKSSNWASGFLPGTLWYLYGLTGKDEWKTAAEESTAGLESRASATDNDTGFQIYGSYGIGRNMLGGSWDEADALIATAANTLVEQRWNENVGAFRAWPQGESDPYEVPSSDEVSKDDKDGFEVNVDMIMNMEVILSAAEKSGNSVHIDAAISHGDIAWDNLMRADYGSYHVAGFSADGSLSYNRTHQGWHEDSTWSRGQSWAIYGYAMLYQYTGLPRMLERSENAYQYFKLATHAQGESWIPYADFDADIGIRNPLDTSASAVVASAALSLYEITGKTQYLSDANDIINALIQDYLSGGTDFESLLLAGSEQYFREDDDSTPDSDGYEVGSSFGDFYFVEALYRLENANSPTCD